LTLRALVGVAKRLPAEQLGLADHAGADATDVCRGNVIERGAASPAEVQNASGALYVRPMHRAGRRLVHAKVSGKVPHAINWDVPADGLGLIAVDERDPGRSRSGAAGRTDRLDPPSQTCGRIGTTSQAHDSMAGLVVNEMVDEKWRQGAGRARDEERRHDCARGSIVGRPRSTNGGETATVGIVGFAAIGGTTRTAGRGPRTAFRTGVTTSGHENCSRGSSAFTIAPSVFSHATVGERSGGGFTAR